MTKQELPDAGSPVSGFGIKDFDTKCPNNPNRVCQTRVQLVRQYVGDLGVNDTDGSIPERVFSDRNVLLFKLLEHTSVAVAAKCVDATDTYCPPRKAMDKNPVRKASVKGIRNIMSMLGIRGH